eukprot:TRINITY_DN3114_c0_g2_i4.p1 TRINITY_DN3114_c0_g2~~TRINITY_DN3114_c0_g2_i4.p1  ORF type:complete len:552 (+),score=100.88 TRINITY_DN3114_c0_g2_i4:28-1683(+)
MIRRPPRSTQSRSSAASDVYKRQVLNYVKTKYTTSCGNYFKQSIKVFPAKGPIVVDGVECETNNPKLINQGVDGADLVIVVKFESNPGEDYVAAATFCQIDSRYNNRPTAGVMVINTAHLRPFNEEDWTSHFTTCVHELTHVMAMNPALFDYYVSKDGKRLGWNNVVKKGVYGGVRLDLLAVEPLVSRARKYFNCPSIEGFALEGNNTNPSVPDGHFNPNWLLNEIMAPRDNDEVVVSEFFFALYEATGWYLPVYKYAELSTFGRKLGCGYLKDGCIHAHDENLNSKPPANPFYYEFCPNEEDSGCTATYDYKGVCISDPSSNPCLYYLADKSRPCYKGNENDPSRGEVSSPESKCILGTIHKTSSNDNFSGRCYKVQCEEKDGKPVAKIVLGNNEEVLTCTESNKPVSSTKFKGYIVCPNIDVVCHHSLGKCPKACSHKGSCVNGVCACHIGYAGSDCSQKADWEKSFYNPPIQRRKVNGTESQDAANFSIPVGGSISNATTLSLDTASPSDNQSNRTSENATVIFPHASTNGPNSTIFLKRIRKFNVSL